LEAATCIYALAPSPRSELARLGKEKILFAARERLLGVRGRTALLSPTVQVEPLLLPGAMALLHQLRRYDLVLQLSEEGAALGARGMRASSRDTLRDLECDMALATALAQCGLADRALRESKPALACARLQEALQLLTDAPVRGRQPQHCVHRACALDCCHQVHWCTHALCASQAAAPGCTARDCKLRTCAPASPLLRSISPSLNSCTSAAICLLGYSQAVTSRQLAPRLQQDIKKALADYHPDAVSDYLQVPLDQAEFDLRTREVAALRQWVAAPAAALRRDQSPILTPEYMARIVPKLTSVELVAMYDWQALAAGGSSARCPWYHPGLLKRAALAHLVAGFVERRPLLLQIARRLFATIQRTGDDADTALSLAMCDLLLGDTDSALKVLEEDERAQQQQQQALEAGAAKRGKGRGAAAAEMAAAAGSSGPFDAHRSSGSKRSAGPEGRHAVMQFIRTHSPEDTLDLRPGLVVFGAWWLERVAYPEFQDTALGAAPRPDVAAYFEDPRVQAFLAAEDGKPTGGLRGMLSNARASLLARFAPPLEEPLPSSVSSSNGAGPLLPRVDVRAALPWLAGATALASVALYAASVARSMGWQPWQQQPEPLPPAMAEAAAAIGLPEYAVRPHYSAELNSQLSRRRPRQAAAVAAAPEQQQQQQQPAAAISRQAAMRLVQQWLNIKTEAMGPYHSVDRLQEVLAEPMLSAVSKEAIEAAEAGWFWRIRPLKVMVRTVWRFGINVSI
jgi:hypothetical protein